MQFDIRERVLTLYSYNRRAVSREMSLYSYFINFRLRLKDQRKRMENKAEEESVIQEKSAIQRSNFKIGKQWDFVAPMESKRCGHSATAHENFIYSIGGFDEKNNDLASVERYNINSNSWESVASLQSYRYLHASVCCGDSIF